MDRHVDTIVLVARTVDRVSQAVGIGRWVTVLLLLKSQEVVGGDTLDNVRSTRQTNRLDDSGDADLILLNQR